MQNLQRLVNECYEAAVEEVSSYVAQYAKGELTHLQFCELLVGSGLNIALAAALLSKSKPALTTFLSSLALLEVQKDSPEVSAINEVSENP